MRRHSAGCRTCPPRHFNPRIPYGMRRGSGSNDSTDAAITIHASHTGCDCRFQRLQTSPCQFQSTPHTGCDIEGAVDKAHTHEFQSTHPIRDATLSPSAGRYRLGYFNPRIPYGMRLTDFLTVPLDIRISIHASHTGCDSTTRNGKSFIFSFQSTHPIRDATRDAYYNNARYTISIHASHTGCDFWHLVM